MGTNGLSEIRINQTGYMTALPVLVGVLSEGSLQVKDSKGSVVIEKKDIKPEFDASSGDNVALVNLGILPEGEYNLISGACERKITVSDKAYDAVTGALIKGLYYQRCGCGLKEEHAGIYAHPACHTAECTEWEDRSIKKKVLGGWHDAGDYGKYVGPGAVTVAHMLYAYRLFPEGCTDNLNIPESGNGVPDILNEARWELEWLLKMQKDDGSFYHKLTKDHFAPFIMPETDTDPEYLIPASHCATEAAIACLALGSRIYKEFDADFSEKMLAAALKGWEWVEKNPEFKPFMGPREVRTGGYGDLSDKDERFWAACELFACTGDEKYKEAAEKTYELAKDPKEAEKIREMIPEPMRRFFDRIKPGLDLTQYGWMDVSGLGSVCCLFEIGEKGGSILYDEVKRIFLEKTGKLPEICKASGYGTALKEDQYVWGSILSIMGNAMSMILNRMLTGSDEMLECAANQFNYALGLNALDISFVTGFGERRVMNIHHRPSGSDNIEEPVPGLISGGPNSKMNFPDTKEKLGEGTPPAKCFLDEMPSADTNEIAIYWNSPAIFVGAYLNSLK